MADKAKRMARDFKALDKEAIPQGLKDFLIKEGPMRSMHSSTVPSDRRIASRQRGGRRECAEGFNKRHGAAARPAGVAMVQGIINGVESGRAALSGTWNRSSVEPFRRPRMPPVQPRHRSGWPSSAST